MQLRTRPLLAWLFVLVAACGDNLTGDVDATPGGDGNTGGDGADVDAAIDADPGPDAAVGVICGAATCGAGMECCVQGMNRTCVASGACNGLNFDCDGEEDCPALGEVCCSGGGAGQNGGTSCTAEASCPMPTCGDATDCPTGQNLMCCALGPVHVCLAQCPP